MIVKILSSAHNFAGIQYSERKNDLGKSELLMAENFGALNLNGQATRIDYINYMKAVAALNPRVKNKQFHAVISAKGKSESVENMAKIGKLFLEKMGYGQNPYLIYHHSDTDNTHIHLVSTRVDKNGFKIDDAFEKIRAQKAMLEIRALDPKYEADMAVKKAMQYNFSTIAQFKLLLELQGFKIKAHDTGMDIIRYGTVQRTIGLENAHKKILDYQAPPERTRQLKAIFEKYAIGLSEVQWKAFMKEKFGMDLIFHRKDKTLPAYGYTIVDHADKQVFKGSQIMKLSQVHEADRLAKIQNLVGELASRPGLSMNDLRLELDKLGLKINPQGIIQSNGNTFVLSANLLRKLSHQERLDMAHAFKINDPGCKRVLAALLSLKASEITLATNHQPEAIKVCLEYLDQSKSWKEGLEHFHFHVLKGHGQHFLLSETDLSLVQLEKLMGRKINLPEGLSMDVNVLAGKLPTDAYNQVYGKESLLEALLDIMGDTHMDETNNKNKHRPMLQGYKTIKR